MIASALKKIFASDPTKEQAHVAYVAIVSQARQPVFFEQWGAEDTLDGRFDLIVLHLCLVLSRLEKETSAQARHFSRALTEVFFSDMDRSLRELGASDTGIGKRINKMAQAFYGRLKSYQEALDGQGQLDQAIIRNVYRDKAPAEAIMQQWMDYCSRNQTLLAQQTVQELYMGQLRFSF